jgi:hypothetical protein
MLRPAGLRLDMDGNLARAKLCAANNADLYQSVFRAHGIGDQRNAAMWWSEEPAPPYYSNLTTLDPDAYDIQSETVAGLKSTLGRSFSVKDGFCRLDLEASGFRQLFSATWIWAEAEQFASRSHNHLPRGWRRIGDVASLDIWETAWTAGGSPTHMRVFPQAILDDPGIVVLGRAAAEGFDAGCIANLSQGAIGLSNVFSIAEPAPAVFEEAALAVSAVAPGRPLVGYEHDEALVAAQAAGFQPVGALRIWLLD